MQKNCGGGPDDTPGARFGSCRRSDCGRASATDHDDFVEQIVDPGATDHGQIVKVMQLGVNACSMQIVAWCHR